MTDIQIFPQLDIPTTIAAGPGPGNTDERVLARFAGAGIADHMQADVLRGMIECKLMLREVWGTRNVHTFGVAGTGWSGLDCLLNAILPGDTAVVFTNGTFSGIDGLTVRMKAASREDLAASPMDPRPANVTIVEVPHGQSVDAETIEAALATAKPKWAMMAHWETGSGRTNDIRGLSDACERHGVMGLVDAVSSLGVADFSIDDYPGIVGWASCPQKGMMCLPLTYAPVSFSDRYIAESGRPAAPRTATTRSSRRGTGASSTARTWRSAPITAPIRAMPSPPSTRRCGCCSRTAGRPRRPTTGSTRRRCARR